MISAKINVSKILKEHLFKGEKGTYLDITLIENKEGTDQYGNDYFVVQDLGKEAREKGEKGPILGNAKVRGAKAPANPAPASTTVPKPVDDSGEIPF
jgi:hypothetical protein